MPSAAKRWIPVVVWVAAIYTTIGFVRRLREWYVERWDPVFIGWAVTAVLVAAAGTAAIVLLRRAHVLRPGAIQWLSIVTVILVLWTYSLRRSPEEAVHFIEYGLLAILLHRALRPTIPGSLLFVAGALVGALIGTVDEVIQWFSPNRFWDWRDIGLNAGAGAIVQFALWRLRPPRPEVSPPRSQRIVLRLASALLLLLTLCLANTPHRVARYAPFLPGFEHLTSPENPMAEYGHLHRVPSLGSFKSRLDIEDLDREDRNRSSEVARLVDGSRYSYGTFLSTWPVSEDPFTYEMRVHLFARGRNLGKARDQEFKGSAAVEQLTTSWHENRLLEEFFGRSLEQSAYVWPPDLQQRVASRRNPEFVFQSAAGSHLITFATEKTLRLLLLVLFAACVTADLRIRSTDGRRS
jgi:hypothetical protein